jgi:hypothetical protein
LHVIDGIIGDVIRRNPYLWYAVVLNSYVNICVNPLVYALKYRRVQQSARRLLAKFRLANETVTSKA